MHVIQGKYVNSCGDNLADFFPDFVASFLLLETQRVVAVVTLRPDNQRLLRFINVIVIDHPGQLSLAIPPWLPGSSHTDRQTDRHPLYPSFFSGKPGQDAPERLNQSGL